MIISVDGLMGSGKTTLLDRLEKRGFKVFREPVGEWKFLDKFYKNPKKYALALQLEILVSFTKYTFAEDIVFTERCPQVSHYVFAKMLSAKGTLTDEEMATYKNFYDKMNLWKPDVHIFLKCPIDVCEQRLKRRSDSYTIDTEYMEILEKYYSIFNKYTTSTPIKFIDASKNEDEVEEDFMNQVKDFVKDFVE
ncbi:kinase protein [Paramecium bursaria Chlorella virus KS1B]|nr:kinase protein [Paramecium bursaria Chlorella virus KS1B]